MAQGVGGGTGREDGTELSRRPGAQALDPVSLSPLLAGRGCGKGGDSPADE